MCTIGPTRFMGLLADLSSREPGLRIHLVEGVPGVLAERLEAGELDVAVMAAPQGLPDRLNVHSLYRERFVVAFPVGHRFEAMRSIPVSAVEGESYLRRVNCEFRDHLAGLCEERGFHVNLAYASEREDWIQNMVVGGLGICFIPEFSAVAPGILTRPVVDPEVWRNVSLVSMAGRRFSPAVATFIKAVTAYRWADGASPHVRIAA
jgi:LysR family transcriptional regulator, hydrogen peroxide-inducible genes activator